MCTSIHIFIPGELATNSHYKRKAGCRFAFPKILKYMYKKFAADSMAGHEQCPNIICCEKQTKLIGIKSSGHW